MHQRRWIELFSDYNCEIRYDLGMANVVADALSRKERVKLRRVHLMSMTIQSSVKDKILAAQGNGIAQKDKNKAKRTKPSTRMERVREMESESESILILNQIQSR
ncbi:hypothetical protein Tco_0301955 [Tanacetum coccineum]